jgi:hypothetical protein
VQQLIPAEATEAAVPTLQAVLNELRARRELLTRRESSVGAPLLLDVDLRGKGLTVVEVSVSTDVAAEFVVEGSTDGSIFRETDRITLPPGGGSRLVGYWNAYPFVRVRTTDVGNHSVEIVAVEAH